MILINLLPHREMARQRARQVFNVSLVLALLAGALIAGAIYLWYQQMIDRRSLIKRAGIAGVLAAGAAPAVHAQAAVRWRLASSFPKSLDTIYGGAEVMAKKVKEMSGGKFEIDP